VFLLHLVWQFRVPHLLYYSLLLLLLLVSYAQRGALKNETQRERQRDTGENEIEPQIERSRGIGRGYSRDMGDQGDSGSGYSDQHASAIVCPVVRGCGCVCACLCVCASVCLCCVQSGGSWDVGVGRKRRVVQSRLHNGCS